MSLKAVIFDFDYTLADSTQGIVQSINHALRQMDLPEATEAQIRPTIGLSLPETFQALTGNQNPAAGAEFSRLFMEKADEVMTPNTFFLPHAVEMLRKLKEEGYRTGIVTTKYRYRIEQILKLWEYEDLVDGIIGREDVVHEKPDPQGLLKLTKMWKVDVQEIVYIGDSIVDAKTAERAGAPFLAVTTGATPREAFADFPCVGIVENLSGLSAMLRAISEKRKGSI